MLSLKPLIINTVVSALENCVALKATPTCTWKLDMNFDEMAFAHMLKDYSMFPGLVMQFSGLF